MILWVDFTICVLYNLSESSGQTYTTCVPHIMEIARNRTTWQFFHVLKGLLTTFYSVLKIRVKELPKFLWRLHIGNLKAFKVAILEANYTPAQKRFFRYIENRAAKRWKIQIYLRL